jgi:hypothetical protein
MRTGDDPAAGLPSITDERLIRRLLAGQSAGIKQRDDRIWLVSFDDETWRLEPLANPFEPKVLPMSSE